jgi:galactokinase/mevalonate kinase-like predicted kinase
MSSSTRKKAIEIWGYSLPIDEPEKLAKVLFSFENPPGKKEISGSQDSIGIVFPGLNIMHYNGEYWPYKIESCHEEDILSWLEERLHFVPLNPRASGYDVLANTTINTENAKALADATFATWEAIYRKDLKDFGRQFRASFEAQVTMFPNMINEEVLSTIDLHKQKSAGWKLSGAGGGGYLVFISEDDIPDAIKIKIRRKKGVD